MGPLSGTRRAPHYFVADHLGSVVGLFTATGTWAGGYSYTPYGERRFTASGLNSNNWRYAGTFEQSPNLYKMGARYYDAATGRFTQMDPTGQEPNPYTYAHANPCNNVDRTGTNAVTCILGVLGVTASLASDVRAVLTLGAALAVGSGVGIVAGIAGLFASALGGSLMTDWAHEQCTS